MKSLEETEKMRAAEEKKRTVEEKKRTAEILALTTATNECKILLAEHKASIATTVSNNKRK